MIHGGTRYNVIPDTVQMDGTIRDMEKGWEPGLSLGRVDNNQGYNKFNCRWQSIFEQNARDSKRQRQPNGKHAEPAECPF
jgi:hypothetical protein